MRQTRRNLLLITLSLVCLGIVMVYSSSALYGYHHYKDAMFYLKRHLLYACIGIALAAFVMAMDYAKLRAFSKPILFLSIVLLLCVYIPGLGVQVGGAKRWIRIGNFTIQPSEFVKLAIIIYLADFLSRKKHVIKSFVQGFLPPSLIVGATLALVLAQPDLGKTVSIAVVAFLLYAVAGINFAHMVSVFLFSLPLVYSLVYQVAYRRKRILAFLNPWQDPRGAGYQIIQSYIALGSGGLLGVGLGASRQKLFYLPQSHTDFIFSIIGEELGLVGASAVIILFFLFVTEGMRISARARDLFGQLLGVGITSTICMEALINIGASIGAIPTKGLPLPFVSYGGSAIIANLIGVGLLLNIAKNRRVNV
ncbi:MAG: putative lipid II flippase FtsW [Candidatus Omnitrophota bacterium]